MTSPTRVGVVDDHPSIVAALSGAIALADGLELAGTGGTVADGLALVPNVDVLVCDVQLAGHAEGLAVLEAAQGAANKPAVLLVSGFGSASVVRAAIERGAAGYLDKGADIAAIVEAIRTVAAGGTVFRASDLTAAHSAPRRPSERELDVIAGVVGGATNGEIAGRLGLSEKTIETHLHRLFDRYGLLSRTELAVLAINEGWAAESRDAS
ncbi:MAG: LuxR C-terminal-related transcriptional regulator [Chloroflexota bacterium]